MKLFRIAIIMLFLLTIILSIMSAWAYLTLKNLDIEPFPEYGLFILAERLSEKPTDYWVLTNSSTIEELLIVTVTHPNVEFKVKDQEAFLDFINYRSSNIEYQGEYYHILRIFKDPPGPPSILITSLPLGFTALGVCWFFVGLSKWKQRKLSSLKQKGKTPSPTF